MWDNCRSVITVVHPIVALHAHLLTIRKHVGLVLTVETCLYALGYGVLMLFNLIMGLSIACFCGCTSALACVTLVQLIPHDAAFSN